MSLGIGSNSRLNGCDRGGQLVGRHSGDALFQERRKFSRSRQTIDHNPLLHQPVSVRHRKPLRSRLSQLQVGDLKYQCAAARISPRYRQIELQLRRVPELLGHHHRLVVAKGSGADGARLPRAHHLQTIHYLRAQALARQHGPAIA